MFSIIPNLEKISDVRKVIIADISSGYYEWLPMRYVLSVAAEVNKCAATLKKEFECSGINIVDNVLTFSIGFTDYEITCTGGVKCQ